MAIQKHVYAYFLLGVILFPFLTFAQGTASPKGSHPATKDDLEWMRWTGAFPEVKEGFLVNPDDPNIGKNAGEVKKWLSEHAVKGAKIRCINPQVAAKLKEFMEAVPGGPPIITSAYRSQAEQQMIINRGDGTTHTSTPCQSYHPWGAAADFNQNTASQGAWMRQNASQYGFNTLRESFDPNHFQWQSKPGQCGGCTADGPDGTLPPASASPSAGFANTLRQAFGMQQQPIQQPPLPPQPLPQTQPIISSFTEPIIATTSAPTIRPTTTSSVADKLEELAFGTKATTTQNATSVPIVINGRDVATLKGTPPQSAPSTNTTAGGLPIQNTFATQDLSWQATYTTPLTSFQQILANIREALLAMLQYLKPFGGAVNPQGNSRGLYLE